MTTRPKILLVCDSRENAEQLLEHASQSHEVIVASNPLRALAHLRREPFGGVYISSEYLQDALQIGRLLQNEQILEGMPDGAVLLDSDNLIIWSNGRLSEWSERSDVVGANFYTVLGSPEILGPDFCPFHTALATGQATSSTLRSGDNRYYHVHAAPLREAGGPPRHLIVTVRDVTNEVHQQQKMAAIHQAGMELADLSAAEIAHMAVGDRIELLKSNILHFTRDLLRFDVVEIRLLDQKTGRLGAVAVDGHGPGGGRPRAVRPVAEQRRDGLRRGHRQELSLRRHDRGPAVSTGRQGRKSSLTVPLVLHDEVIGTFNVESPEPRAFTESDLQFLEIFSRDVAAALNTLELLVAEKATTAAESVEAIHSAVALPVDEILNEAVNVMERYIGHEPEVVERLQRILRNARDIKQVIQKVGQKMAPTEALPADVAGGRAAGAAGAADPGGRRRRERPQRRPQPAGALRLRRRDRPRRRRGAVHGPRHGGRRLRRGHRRHPAARHERLRVHGEAPGDHGCGAAGADDRFRLGPRPLDRQGPAGRPPGGALQAVPPRSTAQCHRADYQCAAAGGAGLGGPRSGTLKSSGAADGTSFGTEEPTTIDRPLMYLFLALLALLGHAFLWIGLTNWLHSQGMPRRVISVLTAYFFACTVTIPVLVAWEYLSNGALSPAPAVYVVVCWGVLAATLVRLTYLRAFHSLPAVVRSRSSRAAAIDLAAAAADASELSHHFLARLPQNEILQLAVSQYELDVPRLAPALDGLKVAHLSDLHFTGRIGKAYFREAVRVCNELQPDLICITGDIIDSPKCLDWMADTLGQLAARHGVYYILGNHDRRVDFGQLRRTLDELGLVDVGARWLPVEVRGTQVLVGGNERPWLGPPSLDGQIRPHATNDNEPLRILLAHSPDQLPWARAHQADLMLAGHTHGGQICIPPLGAIFSPTAGGVKYISGIFHVPPTILHVTRGISGDVPVRWNCPPEIAELRLRAGAS